MILKPWESPVANWSKRPICTSSATRIPCSRSSAMVLTSTTTPRRSTTIFSAKYASPKMSNSALLGSESHLIMPSLLSVRRNACGSNQTEPVCESIVKSRYQILESQFWSKEMFYCLPRFMNSLPAHEFDSIVWFKTVSGHGKG